LIQEIVTKMSQNWATLFLKLDFKEAYIQGRKTRPIWLWLGRFVAGTEVFTTRTRPDPLVGGELWSTCLDSADSQNDSGWLSRVDRVSHESVTARL